MSSTAAADLDTSVVLWQVPEGYIVGDWKGHISLVDSAPTSKSSLIPMRTDITPRWEPWYKDVVLQSYQVGPYLVTCKFEPRRPQWYTKGQPQRMERYIGEHAEDWRAI